jgi:hypothetical protein
MAHVDEMSRRIRWSKTGFSHSLSPEPTAVGAGCHRATGSARLFYHPMKIILSFLMLSCVLISTKAQEKNPSDVLKQDGVLRISDGSSYYEFRTNGTFSSFPVGNSGRCFKGTWKSTDNPNACSFTVTAKMYWMNGGGSQPTDDWEIIFRVFHDGLKKPSPTKGPRPEVYDCYFYIEELTKIPKADK